jgi:hypothetical protein
MCSKKELSRSSPFSTFRRKQFTVATIYGGHQVHRKKKTKEEKFTPAQVHRRKSLPQKE